MIKFFSKIRQNLLSTVKVGYRRICPSFIGIYLLIDVILGSKVKKTDETIDQIIELTTTK